MKRVHNQLMGSEFSQVTIGNHNNEWVPLLTFRSREVIGLCFAFCNGPEKILNQWKWFLYVHKEETLLFPTVFGKIL